jgi:lipopolysaccharide export system protein LptA
MKPLARESASAAAIITLVLSAGLLAQGAAAQGPTPAAPPATASSPPAGAPAGTSPLGGTSKDPIDITTDSLEVIQPQHVYIYTGNVEAIQDDARLRSPKIFVYTKEKPPNGAPKAATSPMAGPDMGSIDHMDAEGPVYYITPTQNARGDHGHWDAATNTITLDGNVVLAQGKSVGKGDHLIINRATGVSHLVSDNTKSPSGRVRTILYPQQQTPAAGAPAPASPAGKPS